MTAPSINHGWCSRCGWHDEWHGPDGRESVENLDPERILICGSRKFAHPDLVRRFVVDLPSDITIIHGDHWEGVDAVVRATASAHGRTQERYPAHWQEQGRKAGPLRNQEMLDKGKPDRVVAFLDWSSTNGSPGTRDMIRRAYTAGIPVTVYGVDGREMKP